METKESEMVDVEIKLDEDQLEFIQKNNIDLSALIKEKLDKLIHQEGYPSIIYDKTHDILYVEFKYGCSDTVPIVKDCYARKDMETGEVIGFHIEDFVKKTNDEDFRIGMFEKLKEGEHLG